MSDFVSHLRDVNAVLALLVTFGVCYRLPQAWAGVSSRRLFIALAMFPPVVGLGSVQARVLNAPVGPVTVILTGCYVFLGWVCVRWPKQLNREENR